MINEMQESIRKYAFNLFLITLFLLRPVMASFYSFFLNRIFLSFP